MYNVIYEDHRAGVAELVDALGLGPSSVSCAGSSPVTRTITQNIFLCIKSGIPNLNGIPFYLNINFNF